MYIKRAALALLWQEGEVLAVSRKDDSRDLGFPGGKVNLGESVRKAAARELKEEADVDAEEDDFEEVYTGTDSAGFLVTTFRVRKWKGEPRSVEGTVVKWVPPRRMLEESCSWVDYNRALFSAVGIIPA